MSWILNAILSTLGVAMEDTVFYIGASILIGLPVLLLLHFIIFTILVTLSRKDQQHFEYAMLQRKWLKAVAWLMLAVLLTAEIVGSVLNCWQPVMALFVPLWVFFAFVAIMTIINTLPLRARAAKIKTLEEKVR